MTTIIDMTPSELRIACAEKCGWRYTINNTSLFFLKNKDNQSIVKFAVSNYPDYEHDMNACIELMEKIWEKYPDAHILKYDENGYLIGWYYGYTKLSGFFVPDSFVIGNTINITIMRAFLTVMEDNQ